MRILMSLLIALSAAPAFAKWMKVDEATAANHYIDPATARKDGQFRRVEIVIDLKQRGQGGEMSWRAQEEYDCKEGQYRMSSPTGYSESMGGGKALRSEPGSGKWINIAPNTPADNKRRILCSM